MNYSLFPQSRRRFLSAAALGAAAFTTRGLFAEELARPDAGPDRRPVLPQQTAVGHRQRSADRQRPHHAGRRRGDASERPDPRCQGQPGAQRPRRDLAGGRQGRLHPYRRFRPQEARRKLPGLRPLPDRLQRRVLFPHHQAGAYPGRTPHIHFKIKRARRNC